jgi:methionine synthase II (cobalamin-independent)
MQFWSGHLIDDHGSRADFFGSLAQVYREEIDDLAARGATFIQLDEVALAMLCDPDVRAAVEAEGEVWGTS